MERESDGVLEQRVAAPVDVRRDGVGQDVATPPPAQAETATLQTQRHRRIAPVHVRPGGQISGVLQHNNKDQTGILAGFLQDSLRSGISGANAARSFIFYAS